MPDKETNSESADPKGFLGNLKKSGILSKTALNKLLSELKKRNASFKFSAGQLTNHFVDSGLITKWQCEKLLRGRYKGFFLGKYKLLDHLGTGGMSTVYLAEHTLTAQKRAIKVLPRKKMSERSYLSRFYREGKAVAALNHPNIVRIYDICGENDTHYMVMEYVQGSDLFDVVNENGPVEFGLARDCTVQAAQGLSHAHKNRLVHRDIKPANLLLTHDGQLKILDLGLALLKSDDDQFALSEHYNERMMGTADYLSPEQAVNSHDVDHRADIYSLGCTLYYLLTGRPPFAEGSLAQRIAMHQSKQPQAISDFRPDCPVDLLAICQTMMQKNPDRRFQNCIELAEALKSGNFAEADIVTDGDANLKIISGNPPASKTDISQSDVQNKRTRPRKSSAVAVLSILGALGVLVTVLAYIVIAKSFADPAESSRESEVRNANQIETAQTNRSVPDESTSTPRGVTRSPEPTAAISNPAQTSTVSLIVDFEDSSRFSSRLDRWDLIEDNVVIGTLFVKSKGKVVAPPDTKSGKIGAKCLLISGNSKKVEFRPIDKTTQIHGISFLACRQDNGLPFSIEIEAKSHDRFEKWRTVYVVAQEINENVFSEVVIGPEFLNAIDSRKFRFRIEGDTSNGVFIDNLSIRLR